MRQLLILFFLSSSLFSISQDSIQLRKKFLRNQNIALVSLSSWSLVNISFSSLNLAQQPKIGSPISRTTYYYQMNLTWNFVNMGICSLSYIKNRKYKSNNWPNLNLKNTIQKYQKSLLLNSCLDIVYITSGILLRINSNNISNIERSIGFGNSLITQGCFLLAFDLIYLQSLRKLIN